MPDPSLVARGALEDVMAGIRRHDVEAKRGMAVLVRGPFKAVAAGVAHRLLLEKKRSLAAECIWGSRRQPCRLDAPGVESADAWRQQKGAHAIRALTPTTRGAPKRAAATRSPPFRACSSWARIRILPMRASISAEP